MNASERSEAKRHVAVLGGGIAGLATAYQLTQEGLQVTVLERSAVLGGLARSYRRGPFTYDFGPHRFHTKNPQLIELITRLLGDNLEIRHRKSRIFMENRFFDYPLQVGNILRNMPPTFLLRAFWDYFLVRLQTLFVKRPERNFEEWVLNRYGRKLYRTFFGVYTEKTWGIPCTQISADWASQRITLLNLWDVVKKTLFRARGANEPRTYVSRFWYPREGGIGMICRRLAEEVERGGNRVLTEAAVEELVAVGNRIEAVRFRHRGEPAEIRPEAVISTIPITLLCQMVRPEAPPEVLAAVRAMRHRSMVFVYVALNRPRVTDDHWIYLPDPSLTIHRISEFKNFSERNAPPDKTLLCCEITCNFQDEIWQLADEKLGEIAVRDLTRLGLIRPEEVLEVWSHRARFAYPIYDLQYAERLRLAKGFVERFENLYTAGRQGLFKYNNMDHSIEMGIEVSRDLLLRRRAADRVASGSEYFG